MRTLCALVLLCLFCGDVFGAPIPEPSAVRMTPTVKAVRKALPWVVSIGTTQQIIQVNDPFSLFFTDFFSQPRRVFTKFSPLGSGVIVDAAGLVVTNYHVVRRASALEVQLWDGTSLRAQVVGYDINSDLCLLKLSSAAAETPLPELTAAEFAAVDDLFLGESVIAIGNPFGLGHSVATGVISALNRSFQEGDFFFENLLQTDAAINPGNSGGPLVNLDGQLVGINQAIRADAQGIGFAIPLSHIEHFLAYWLATPAHFSDACLGIEEPRGSLLETDDGLGVLLGKVLPDSPLARAGLAEGSRVLAIDGKAVNRPLDFGRAVWSKKAGEIFAVEFVSADGTPTTQQVALLPMPDGLLVKTRLGGVELTDLNDKLRKALHLRPDQGGVVVSDAPDEPTGGMQGAQWRQVLRRGDIVLQFDGQDDPTVETIAKSLRKSRAGEFRQIIFYSSAMKVPVEVAALQLD